MESTPHPPQTTIRNGVDVTTIPPGKIRPLSPRHIVARAQKDLEAKTHLKKVAAVETQLLSRNTEEIPEEIAE